MAPRVVFKDQPECASARPFEEEWKLLEPTLTVVNTGSSRLSALIGSDHEVFMPRAFILLFAATMLTLSGLLVYTAVKGIPHLSAAPKAFQQAES